MRFAQTLAVFSLVIPALAVPTRVPLTKRAGPVKPDSFIITFKDAPTKDEYIKSKPPFKDPRSQVVYSYDLIPAMAAMVFSSDLPDLQRVLGVQSIEPDSMMSINYETNLDGFESAQYEPPSDVSQSLEKRSDSGGAGRGGQGVTIYGIDTGIYTDHECFEGRASMGMVYGGYDPTDGNGHGTHTAGTAVGNGFQPGKATAAKIIGVRVLGDDGSGATSDVVMGVQWACEHAVTKGDPGSSIITMSLGGPAMLNNPVSDAVQSGIEKYKVHFTIAAGNSMSPASTSSPANVEAANTIGAVDSDKKEAYFSNFGKLIDVWYYGVNITSAWIGSPNATNTISGTSMSTPGVASIAAYFLGIYGPMSPPDLSQKLKDTAKNEVTLTLGLGTSTNKLAST